MREDGLQAYVAIPTSSLLILLPSFKREKEKKEREAEREEGHTSCYKNQVEQVCCGSDSHSFTNPIRHQYPAHILLKSNGEITERREAGEVRL